MAGLIDPSEQIAPESHEGLKKLAVDFVLMLCRNFNRKELEAITLWERIGSALESAYAKTPSAEPYLFVSHCLRHIKAEKSRVLSDPEADRIMDLLENESPEFVTAFINYLVTRDYVVLTQAKRAWEYEKKTRKGGE